MSQVTTGCRTCSPVRSRRDAGLKPQSDLADDASVQGDDAREQPMDLADADVDDGSSDQASLDDGNGFDDGGTFDDGGDDGGGDDSSFS